MSEQPSSESSADALPTPSFGEWLRTAREQAGLTVDHIARDLHLDASTIQHLEENNFRQLGAPVYAKGYLRRYARLVGLSDVDVLRRYEQLNNLPGNVDPVPVTRFMTPVPRYLLSRWLPWISGLIVILAIALVVWQFMPAPSSLSGESVSSSVNNPVVATPAVVPTVVQGSTPIEVTSSDATEASDAVPSNEINDKPTPLQAMAEAQAATSTTSNTPLTTSPVASTPIDASKAASASASTPPPVVGSGTMVLNLSFTAQSWVEIYDARGRAVMYDMGEPGSSREVVGTPPLQVTFGSASAVHLSINGQSRNLPANKVRANVAHLVINAAGNFE